MKADVYQNSEGEGALRNIQYYVDVVLRHVVYISYCLKIYYQQKKTDIVTPIPHYIMIFGIYHLIV